MGDSSSATFLSAIPSLIIIVLLVAMVIVWRSGRRRLRIGAGVMMMLFGASCFFTGVGALFSLAGGLVIGGIGLGLLIAGSRGKRLT